ncbi:MAG: murein biosynthesis integral membrane protein MurJ [Candidatus Omnitrophota bacterium]
MRDKLLKAAGIMGVMTLLSRVLGLFRDIVNARSFGTSWQWDAFIYAFMVPNFFRRIVAEGALNSAFIPVYSGLLATQRKEEAQRFANQVLTVLTLFFMIFLFFIEMALYFLMKIPRISETLHLAFDLMRYLFPYLWAISLYSLGMGILNSHKRFFLSSLGPMILNLGWIVSVLWVIPHAGPHAEEQLRWLAVLLFLTALIEFCVEWPQLHTLGFRFRFIWDFGRGELRRFFQLLLPAALGFSIVPLNVLVDMTLGLWIGKGASSSLWYGNHLMQFPMALFAISMGTALLPTMSRQIAQKNNVQAEKSFLFSVKSVFLIVLPASLGLMILRLPIMQFLFEGGKFDAVSSARASMVLLCYTFGLTAYSGLRIITTAFFSFQDTKTPSKIAALGFGLNIVMNLILMGPLREAGLALATSLSGILQFVLLAVILHRKHLAFRVAQFKIFLLKLALAAAGMAVLCWLTLEGIESIRFSNVFLWKMARVFAPMAVAVLAYGAFAWLLKIEEFKDLFRVLKEKKKNTSLSPGEDEIED